MHSTVESASVSKQALWSGRIISGLVVLFISITKIMRVPQVIDATVNIGFPASTVLGTGITLLVCMALHVIAQTSVLGAISLTGYLAAPRLRTGASTDPHSIHASRLRSEFSSGSGCSSAHVGCETYFRRAADSWLATHPGNSLPLDWGYRAMKGND